jgi:fatty acid desaturase
MVAPNGETGNLCYRYPSFPEETPMNASAEIDAKKPCVVPWYRTPLDPALFKRLHQKSDFLGALQTLGFLGTFASTGALALWSAGRWPAWGVALAVFLHGTVAAFMINAVHELGHGTVFRTRSLNAFFTRVFAFFGWIHDGVFLASHQRHHLFTLHPPDDLEVVLPRKILVKHFFQYGFVNPLGLRDALKTAWRLARGRFEGKWELALFPESDPAKRRAPVLWARFLLVGHASIAAAALARGLWMVPVVVSLAPFCGGWLHFLVNNTQHIGLRDNVADFRLCCRTVLLDPVVGFLYWHMQYHIEHHMYAAVPCYRLAALHRAIRHDLPPCPRGIVAAWREIAAIQARQAEDPSYQFSPPLPARG